MQHQAFAAALSQTLLADHVCQLFVGEDAQGGAAALPLSRVPSPRARWRMMGAAELGEPADALFESTAAVEDLALEIRADGHPVTLDRVPASSALLAALKAAMAGKGLISLRPAQPCPTISLHEGWKQPDSQFNAGRRSDFRRAARKAAAFGVVRFEMRSPTLGEFDALFDEAIAVELASWKKSAGSAIAVDGAKEDFFRAYFRSLCAQGAMRIAFMRIDGRAVAMHLAAEMLDRYWLFKIGFDEAYDKCSPGTLLMLHALAWAAERELVAFELLGHVEPWIVAFWTKEQRDCVRLRTYPYNWRGLAALVEDGWGWLAAQLKRRATA